MAILTSSLYPAVRAAIDAGLGSDRLPDAIIALPIYAGAADADVLSRDPDAESRTGSDFTRIQNAAVYFCAARLLPALPQIVRETSAEGYGYQTVEWDVATRVDTLQARALDEIDVVIGPSPPDDITVVVPPFFIATGPTRVRSRNAS